MRQMKKKAYVLASILCMVLLWTSFAGMAKAADGETDDTPVDFVLVLDCSGSMKESDEENLSVSAAKMFIDMIPVENARVGVVAFGSKNWGSEAYVYAKDKEINTCTKAVYPLTEMNSDKAKEDAKEVISSVAAQKDGEYTTLGYALQAAEDMCEQNGTEKENACIILMSDGRLTDPRGDDRGDVYRKNMDGKDIWQSYALDDAIERAAGNEWPVYTLELAFDIKDRYGEGYSLKDRGYKVPTGLFQMERIAEETGAEKFTAFSNLEVLNGFSSIFYRFYDANADLEAAVSELKIEGGNAEKEFTIADMIAETTITITGASMKKITSIELTHPDGSSKVYQSGKNVKEEARIVTFDENYIMLKLLAPKEGKWKIKVNGDDGVNITLTVIPIRELNFRLNTNWDMSQVVAKGGTLDFTANFVYNDKPYSSEQFYKKNKAFLVVQETNEKFEMKGGEDNYTGRITVNQSGNFTVYAVVESGYFRNGEKKSGEITFKAENIPAKIKKDIPDMEMGFNETVTLDCSEYIENPDQDKLNVKADLDASAGIEIAVDEKNILTIKSGVKAGDFRVNLRINDGYMEKDLEQEFSIHLKNQPLKEKGGKTIKKTISYNAGKIPGFLKKMFGIDAAESETIVLSDYFVDADGIMPVFSVREMPADSVIAVKEAEEGVLAITADGAGELSFVLEAKDASDESVAFEKRVEIKSISAGGYIWKKVRVPSLIGAVILLIAIVLLAAAFAGRRIYGVWEATVGGRVEGPYALGKMAHGKKSKCTLNNALEDMGLPTVQDNQVLLKAGNNFSKSVTVTGLDTVAQVTFQGRTYGAAEGKTIKKVQLKKGQELELFVDNQTVILSRLR